MSGLLCASPLTTPYMYCYTLRSKRSQPKERCKSLVLFMKKIIFLFSSLLLLAAGCMTERQQQEWLATEVYGKNSIVVINKSPYRLELFRNNVPWYDAHGVTWPAHYHPVAYVLPEQTIVFSDASTNVTERINIRFDACEMLPGLVRKPVGSYEQTASFGTEKNAAIVIVRKRNIGH